MPFSMMYHSQIKSKPPFSGGFKKSNKKSNKKSKKNLKEI